MKKEVRPEGDSQDKNKANLSNFYSSAGMNKLHKISFLFPFLLLITYLTEKIKDQKKKIETDFLEEIDVKFRFEKNDFIKEEFRIFNPGIKSFNGSGAGFLLFDKIFNF